MSILWQCRAAFYGATMSNRPTCPAVCECGSDDLHIAHDGNGHYIECCGCGTEYEHDGLFPGDPEFDEQERVWLLEKSGLV